MSSAILVDTNVLLRSAQPGHAMYPDAKLAVSRLKSIGSVLCLFPQILYEFWVVSTRPVGANGLGLRPATAEADLAQLELMFLLLVYPPSLYVE